MHWSSHTDGEQWHQCPLTVGSPATPSNTSSLCPSFWLTPASPLLQQPGMKLGSVSCRVLCSTQSYHLVHDFSGPGSGEKARLSTPRAKELRPFGKLSSLHGPVQCCPPCLVHSCISHGCVTVCSAGAMGFPTSLDGGSHLIFSPSFPF